MGSRIMHYSIGTLLARELPIADEEQFLLGGIAPDVNKNMNEPKGRSHFIQMDAEGKQDIDLEGFHAKYVKHMAAPFILGYYYHLIADRMWVDSIYKPKIKWLPQPEKKEAQGKYYRDFWRLNGKLIDYYSLTLKPLQIQPVDMDEIDYRFLPDIIEDLTKDFELKDDAKDQDLEILDMQETIAVLEETVRICKAAYYGATEAVWKRT
ncbi:hypothetical protein [Paenibacillus sacheonensis]|uniref:Phospholipase C/D domain-containing protein n=1 Tax=Paenibacillus sacheonensis TaxID=742054 RepID=A0A7X4YPX1_9BACL|nr:hypothetical protein [Paenibacillus sacheonensis]MBM7565550.1 hypothetical protein [Paenibacillus sacheonensis]NBC69531.1 hypothetical protein [Paenibacillus sacheonensis]